MTKTHSKYGRIYVDGYDHSGNVRAVGDLMWDFDSEEGAALSDGVKSHEIGHPMISPGVINSFFNDDAGAPHTVLSGVPPETELGFTYAQGIRAIPAPGDPVYTGVFPLKAYQAEGEARVASTLSFGGIGQDGSLLYGIPWGNLLHPNGAETGANSGNADHDFGAQTTLGGYGVLHILATNGTCTFSIEDAASAGGPFANLLTFTLPGSSIGFEIVELAVTATVRRALRWQISLGTATSVSFVTSFVRGTGV